jgi:hypothetical protein
MLQDAGLMNIGVRRKQSTPTGGAVKVLAGIEDPVVIDKILVHLQGNAASDPTGPLPESQAPPADLFG